MATTFQNQTAKTLPTSPLDAQPENSGALQTGPDERSFGAGGLTSSAPSRLTLPLSIFVGSIIAIFGFTMASAFQMPGVSALAAFGFGLYCAFWIGIGFGTIFGAAAAFGRNAH